MVYRLHAELRFATAAARTTALNTIGASGTMSLQLGGLPSLVVNRSNAAPATIQSSYTTISGLTSPRVLSFVEWHPCYHGEPGPVCSPPTALKKW